MKWFRVFSPEVLNGNDFVKGIEVSGRKLCAVKTSDKIFVIQNKCPHAGADLSSGWCNNGKIVCPYHRHEFDLSTGRGIAGQGNYVITYPVEVRNDGIYIGFKDSFWKFW
ncbi:Rieske (2Fe-2S) protein [Daejeonella sp.]|uniref:Rieske (2Fe-2S) protein n=1 Tax=Daejeonella sp. TaxID=2805397 RepID=UPI0039834C05